MMYGNIRVLLFVVMFASLSQAFCKKNTQNSTFEITVDKFKGETTVTQKTNYKVKSKDGRYRFELFFTFTDYGDGLAITMLTCFDSYTFYFSNQEPKVSFIEEIIFLNNTKKLSMDFYKMKAYNRAVSKDLVIQGVPLSTAQFVALCNFLQNEPLEFAIYIDSETVEMKANPKKMVNAAKEALNFYNKHYKEKYGQK